MAKVPWYIKLETNIKGGRLKATFKIRRWGIPVLVYKCLKENFDLKWYQWLLYPYLCIRMMFPKGEANGS